MHLFWRFGRFRHYRWLGRGVDATQLAAIRSEILGSPWMAASNLNHRFRGTYGFTVAFQRHHLPALLQQFPTWGPVLEKMLRPECNAFFLNPLLMKDGAGVAPHVDLSLSSTVPGVRTPRYVSVLYVEVPPLLQGGLLRLYEGDSRVATITPRAGTMLIFRGDMRHEVTPVTAGATDMYEARLSLVVEQYRLTEHQLNYLPEIRIGTRRETEHPEAPLSGGAGEGLFGDEVRRWLGPSDERGVV
ncbi:MAG: 2OG-Fe(II) oxygenase [Candidatus Sericytochromatia bacterium]|nr:2OG-Fe(II) oxygenase [Candidatus Sericytochromatia bacterium]